MDNLKFKGNMNSRKLLKIKQRGNRMKMNFLTASMIISGFFIANSGFCSDIKDEDDENRRLKMQLQQTQQTTQNLEQQNEKAHANQQLKDQIAHEEKIQEKVKQDTKDSGKSGFVQKRNQAEDHVSDAGQKVEKETKRVVNQVKNLF